MRSLLKSLIVLMLFLSINKANAQQNTLFNTYLYDPMQLNIAYAADDCSEANLNYRNQWLGLKDSPKLYQLNAHTALGKSTGVALRIASQQAGLLNALQATLGYGYQIKLNNSSKVLFGIGVGFIQNTLNTQKASVVDANDVTLSETGKQKAMGFDSELGVQYLGDKLKGGISVLHLYNSNPGFAGSSLKTLPQVNLTVSYLFNKDKQVELEPMLVSRSTFNGDKILEGLLNVHLKKIITVGAGYRSNYGLLAFVGVKISKFKIAYSFDYGASKNKTLTGSSHQVLLGFNYCKKRPNKVQKTKGRKILKSRF